jgi:hypothetical protein
MVDFWNNLLRDEPIWTLLLAILSFAFTLLMTIWVSPALAKKQAIEEFARTFDLATREELAARHGAYRDAFRLLYLVKIRPRLTRLDCLAAH